MMRDSNRHTLGDMIVKKRENHVQYNSMKTMISKNGCLISALYVIFVIQSFVPRLAKIRVMTKEGVFNYVLVILIMEVR